MSHFTPKARPQKLAPMPQNELVPAVRAYRADPEGIVLQLRGVPRGQSYYYAQQYLTLSEAEQLVQLLAIAIDKVS